MNTQQSILYIAIGLILGFTIATGPIGIFGVPTAEEGMATPTTGNATVEVVSTPDDLTIRLGDTGQGIYYLDIPPATVRVSNLTKNPILVYKLSIDGIGYTKNSVTTLGPAGEGTYQIQLSNSQFRAERIESGSYVGDLSLILRGETEFVILEKTVTIQVVS